MRQQQGLEAGFGLDQPKGDCLGTQKRLSMWDAKVLAADRGIPLMAGSPLSEPENVSFPGTVLPQDTSPRGGTPARDTQGLGCT